MRVYMTAFSPPVILTAVVMAAVALRSSAADRLPLVDLSGETSRHIVIAAGTEKDYQGHPTTAMTADGRVIAVWCTPHGGWCGPAAETADGGKSWKRIDSRFPDGFRRHVNCPSIYRLTAPDGKVRMWVWSQAKMPLDAKHHRDRCWRGEAMPSVMSEDEGRTWKEMPPLGSKFRCVMAFASIVRLRDGSYLGMFHRGPGGEDKSPLTVWQSITKDGGFTWSDPVLVASAKGKDPCEPYVFRSPKGDELCCLLRENTHKGASMMMFSRDEGKTWTKPEDAPWGLTGDRHQGIQLPDGRLVVVFREMAPDSSEKGHFVAWVGSYDAIKSRKTIGTYRVKLLHNYATVDCGYPGIHLLPDGTVLATTYCKYRNDKRKHSVVSVRFRVDETDGRVANPGIRDTYGRMLSWEGVGNVRDLGGLPAPSLATSTKVRAPQTVNAHVRGRIQESGKYESIHPRFPKAFEFMRRPDLPSLSVGRYEIDGTNCWAIIMDTALRPFAATNQYEVHKAFIDIQSPISGPETIGVVESNPSMFGKFNYEKDFALFNFGGKPWNLVPGEFAVFFPDKGAHAPGLSEGSTNTIRKLVIKVRK